MKSYSANTYKNKMSVATEMSPSAEAVAHVTGLTLRECE